ncbi:AzlC family ABC transporter permease [Caenimonas soli]|uniref:AzlC family ABC transporter permease n=1 Tax=Caenimonas soli TaxID=2735555 RepID=UPI001F21D6C8|nr:AzlC family ABC transporter permease [Caenimonas soli]
MSSTAPAAFSAAGVRHGFIVGQPLAPGAFVYGMVFGVLASERGLAWFEALLMSVFVYSGSAQLAVLQGWSNPPVIASLVATVLVINARYLLFGASIQPWLSGATRPQALGTLFVLGDGNWALSMREYHAGYRDAGFILGSGLAMFTPWVVGTLTGHLLGRSVPNPAIFGLDFMLVAFAAAIGIGVWRGRADLWPGIAAAAVALALHRWLPGGWYIVGAGLAAGCVGAARHGR